MADRTPSLPETLAASRRRDLASPKFTDDAKSLARIVRRQQQRDARDGGGDNG